MQLKAQRMINDEPVCKMDMSDKEGTMKVKPTTFGDGVNINALLLCPTCPCEKVDIQINNERTKVEINYFVTLLFGRIIPVCLLFVLQTPFNKANRCNGNGDLVCGKCRCYDGWWNFIY